MSDRNSRNARTHPLLSLPLDGGGPGRGWSTTSDLADTPHPNPPPQGGRVKKGRGALKALCLALGPAMMFATPAFAAGGMGGTIEPVVYELMVFVMAIFVGYYVVWSVTPALHTPLMSVTNAISSVIVVGALLAVAVEHGGTESLLSFESGTYSKLFGLLALAMVAVNIFGGFLVTQRMLGMYKKKGDKR
jgi:proton-translocating NAD(P)+ transhydrogenase subunit alpha